MERMIVKKNTNMAIAVLILGTLGLMRVESETDTVKRAEPAETRQVADERQRCGEICLVSDVPIYVPPNRGATSTRLGGGTRGGSFRL